IRRGYYQAMREKLQRPRVEKGTEGLKSRPSPSGLTVPVHGNDGDGYQFDQELRVDQPRNLNENARRCRFGSQQFRPNALYHGNVRVMQEIDRERGDVFEPPSHGPEKWGRRD